jgi:7,8-dihydroneopterin aldolase/epimerase/oxygenase
MPATITIELKHLRFFAYHGWYDEEAILGNEFEITFLGTFAAKDNIDAIEDTVDYTKIHAHIKTVFMRREKLLETVAQNIIREIEQSFPRVQNIQISITKLNPLIPQFIGTVGITYTKDFK